LAQVNLANGTPRHTTSDGTLSGPGIGLRNDRFYNGLSKEVGSFQGGWSSSLSHFDVYLTDYSGQPTFFGPNGFKAVFSSDGAGGWKAPVGFKATLTYDPATVTYTLTYNQSGERLTFVNGRLVSDADRNGIGNTYTYGIAGSDKVTRVTQASGRYFDFTWSSSPARIDKVTDSAGRSWTYTRTNNQLSRVDGPAGEWETYTYDSSGRISEAGYPGSGGADSRVVFGYDSSSRVTSIKQGAVGSSTFIKTTTFAYAASPKVTTVTDGNGNASKYTIDSAGRVTNTEDALHRPRSQKWTTSGDIEYTSADGFASTGTPGNQTTYTYDTIGNATSVKLPTGAAASATYATGTSCAGTGGTEYQMKCSTDAAGNGKTYDYDANGNLTTVKDSTTGGTGAVPQRYTYHGISGAACGGLTGQICTAKDGNSRVTTYTYNSKGDLLKVTPPSPQGATTYAYDALGRVTAVTDGNGDTIEYEYNQRDQQTTTTWTTNNTTFTTSYFQSGLRNTETDSVNGAKTYAWDVLGRMTNETGPGFRDMAYSYDAVGNLTAFNEDGYSSSATYGTVNYTYNAANQLKQLTQWGGSCPTNDDDPPAADSGCIKFGYDKNGAETTRTFPGNATLNTTVDGSGRATRITAVDSAKAVVADIGYSYTAVGGDRTAIQTRTSYREQGVPAGAVTTYTYDSLNRLKNAKERVGSTSNAEWYYNIDAAGNRTRQTRVGNTGTAAGTIDYVYDAANRLTSTTADTTTWQYDAAGNQTRNGITGLTMSYNPRGAVNGIGSTDLAAFGPGNGNQLSQANPAIVYTNSSAFGGLASTFTNATGSTRAFTNTTGGDMVGVQYGAGSKYYFATDNLGSVIGLFDKTGVWQGGYSYSPYGETRATGTSAPVTSNTARYISGYLDTATGMYKLGARYYDPTTGRFTQYDPTGQEANPFSYGGCNPINSVDPTGTVSTGCLVLGGITAGASLFASVAGYVAAGSAPTVGPAVGAAALSAAGWLVAGVAGIGAFLTCTVFA
jgi:RHS repeat-associated protein